LLLAHALGVKQEDIIAGRIPPDPQGLARFEDALSRRIAHEPIAYITGQREFWSLPFAVDKRVLIPRPESEVLVEEALRQFPEHDAALDVLDLGTGSGCLLLAFLSERPRARGFGVDSSADAVTVASRNARALQLSDRTQFAACDWSGISGAFDIVFANPPYVRTDEIEALAPDVSCYEPRAALDGGTDGLDAYRAIASVLPRLLGSESRAFVELGRGQGPSVAAIFAGHGLDVEGFVNDLAYVPRCLVVVAGIEAPPVRQKKDMEKEMRSG